MPPVKEGPPLTEKQIAVLQAWIDSGAKAPDERAPEDPRKHWAFQKPQRPALPHISNMKFPIRNPIDAFIGAELERHGLQALPAAKRETAAAPRDHRPDWPAADPRRSARLPRG